jgi:hypothetical protein
VFKKEKRDVQKYILDDLTKNREAAQTARLYINKNDKTIGAKKIDKSILLLNKKNRLSVSSGNTKANRGQDQNLAIFKDKSL